MNILYLHGLKSKLSKEKHRILEKYGIVFSPDIDYSSDHVQPQEILRNYPDTEFNVVIGSSMGALNAYIISNWIGRPALLFNPPLTKHPKKLDLPKEKFVKGLTSKQILLGANDEIVDPVEALLFLGKHLRENELEIKIDPHLGHRIPPDLFGEQVSYFFSKLCY
ncbi:hypothetical protein [Salinimicrobium soli]|uniref:hypothetical protein n=1 Tax=Salinimicrobium soli TaxID=1254399 RepID=UPI003AAC748D